MKPVEIIAQIIGVFGMLMSVLSYQQKGKARILTFQLLGSALFVVNFFMLGAFAGAILNFVAIIRALIFIYEDKVRADHPAWTVGLTFVYILSYVAVFTIFEKEPTIPNLIVELLPVLAMTATTIAFRSKEDKALRRVAFISSPLWLTYNIIFFSIGAIIGETLNLISAIIGTIRLDCKKKEEAEVPAPEAAEPVAEAIEEPQAEEVVEEPKTKYQIVRQKVMEKTHITEEQIAKAKEAGKTALPAVAVAAAIGVLAVLAATETKSTKRRSSILDWFM